jgi:glutamate formiminotransferase/formiminotetrahydrofolate cyclodeaminase
MSAAALAAATVPLEVLEHAVTTLQLSLRAARDGNPGSVSDAGVAAACAEAAAWGASLNVRINLPSLAAADQDGISSRHDAAMAEISTLVADVRTAVDATLER